jgi:hypothetical protein
VYDGQVGILKPRNTIKKKTVLKNAEALLSEKIEQGYDTDLTRIGVSWSGILDLEGPIAASEVAAMLASASLIRATTLVDSEEHWTNAAAFSALGHAVELDVRPPLDIENTDDDKMSNPIGFVPQSE